MALQEQIIRVAAWSTAAATMLSSGNAQAASEVAQLAAGDNRLGIIATLALPAVGWVIFNIGGPALNQLANMDKSNKMRYIFILPPRISPCRHPSACPGQILTISFSKALYVAHEAMRQC